MPEPIGLNGKPLPSLAKTRVGAAILIVIGLVMAYFFIYHPVQQARASGELHYYVKGLLLPPLLLYMAVCILFGDMRDGQIKTIGPNGKAHLTSKGWAFVVGIFVVISLTLVAWYFYLSSIGFKAF